MTIRWEELKQTGRPGARIAAESLHLGLQTPDRGNCE